MSRQYENRSDLNAALNEAVERRKDQQKSTISQKDRWKQQRSDSRRKRTIASAVVLLPISLLSVLGCLWYLGLLKLGPPSALSDALQAPTTTTTLRLDGADLGSFPAGLETVTALQQLYLDNNGIASLPDGIGALKKLETLSLSYNTLATLPEALGALPSLRELNLKANSLTGLPSSLGDLSKLSVLDLSNNNLRALPPEIGKLKNLTVLRLRGNSVGELPKSFTRLTALVELDLGGNPLTSLPDLSSMKNLKQLNLRDTGLPPSTLMSLKTRLPKVSLMK